MYPRIPWELVADPKGSVELSLGTSGVNTVVCMSVVENKRKNFMEKSPS
jgi:hypothetical protein